MGDKVWLINQFLICLTDNNFKVIGMPKSKETLYRTFVKTLGWRATATTITVVSTYLISGDMDAAWKVGAVDVIFKLSGHFAYEKLWSYWGWGYLGDKAGKGEGGEGGKGGEGDGGNGGDGGDEGDIEMAASDIAVVDGEVASLTDIVGLSESDEVKGE